MHQAIADNIAYWSQPHYLSWLAESPPFHTSYYCVEEDGALRVYGVKWQGADLSKGEVFTPDNHFDLLCEARKAGVGTRTRVLDIGQGREVGGKLMACGAYVYDSPLRRVREWLPCVAGSYLRERPVGAGSYSFRVDKTRWAVRFVDETETEMTVLVEPKG